MSDFSELQRDTHTHLYRVLQLTSNSVRRSQGLQFRPGSYFRTTSFCIALGSRIARIRAISALRRTGSTQYFWTYESRKFTSVQNLITPGLREESRAGRNKNRRQLPVIYEVDSDKELSLPCSVPALIVVVVVVVTDTATETATRAMRQRCSIVLPLSLYQPLKQEVFEDLRQGLW